MPLVATGSVCHHTRIGHGSIVRVIPFRSHHALGRCVTAFAAVCIVEVLVVVPVASPVSAAPHSAAAPRVTLQPVTRTASLGAIAKFTTAAAGSPTPTVAWQQRSTGSSVWTSFTRGVTKTSRGGVTTSIAIVTASIGVSGSNYRAVFTNRAGTRTTRVVTLRVSGISRGAPSRPVVTSQPQPWTTAFGSPTAKFGAVATGVPAPSVVWQEQLPGATSWTTLTSGVATTVVGKTTTSAVVVSITVGDTGSNYRAVFTNSSGSVSTVPAQLGITPPVGTSFWSGYATTGSQFSAISASWIVPSAICAPGANSDQTQWVGIDGFGNSTVEQDGTEVSCNRGQPYYAVWYETYGYPTTNDVGFSPTLYPVTPGDAITASVTFSQGVWTFVIHDATAGWTATHAKTLSNPQPSQSTAEVIVEVPQCPDLTLCTQLAMSTTTPITFTNILITAALAAGTFSMFTPEPIRAVFQGVVTTQPGPLSSDGSSFVVTSVIPAS
jgi:hypothetical protein